LTWISIFDQNFNFWENFWFSGEISIYEQNLDFFSKIWILHRNFDFWAKFGLFTEISIVQQNLDCSPKFRFLSKIWVVHRNFDFWAKFRFSFFNKNFNFLLNTANILKLWQSEVKRRSVESSFSDKFREFSDLAGEIKEESKWPEVSNLVRFKLSELFEEVRFRRRSGLICWIRIFGIRNNPDVPRNRNFPEKYFLQTFLKLFF